MDAKRALTVTDLDIQDLCQGAYLCLQQMANVPEAKVHINEVRFLVAVSTDNLVLLSIKQVRDAFYRLRAERGQHIYYHYLGWYASSVFVGLHDTPGKRSPGIS